MEEETVQPLKWEGKKSAELPTARAQEVWPFLEDFCNLHKCFDRVDTCYRVDGIPGQPGLIRYCGSTVPSGGGQEEAVILWAKEKLLQIDPIERCLSYEVIDNNIGMESYVATMRVLPIHDDDDEGERGCKIEWSFLCDPIHGQGFEDFSSYVQSSLEVMVKKIEDALRSAT